MLPSKYIDCPSIAAFNSSTVLQAATPDSANIKLNNPSLPKVNAIYITGILLAYPNPVSPIVPWSLPTVIAITPL